MTLQELSKQLNLSEGYIQKKFPTVAKNQLKKGILITREGKYPNTDYTLTEVEPQIVDKSHFSRKPQEDNKIIENEIWIDCIIENYEISNWGRIRNKRTQKINNGSLNSNGYKQVSLNNKTYFVHRLVLQSFNPIENDNLFSVDHLNGIRTDNRLENLQWASMENNIYFMMTHRKELNKELTRLINIYGYEETLKKLQKL